MHLTGSLLLLATALSSLNLAFGAPLKHSPRGELSGQGVQLQARDANPMISSRVRRVRPAKPIDYEKLPAPPTDPVGLKADMKEPSPENLYKGTGTFVPEKTQAQRKQSVPKNPEQ